MNNIASFINNLNIPGCIISIRTDQQTIIQIGYSNIETKEKFTTDQLFKIGSITKLFISVIILQLIEENKLSFDTVVNNNTILNLGKMKSTLVEYSDSIDINQIYDPKELMNINDTYANNSNFNYCNKNTILLGLVIEEITKNSLEIELSNRIFTKLNLTNTHFMKNITQYPNYIHGYDKNKDVSDDSLSWCWAAGGIISTIDDIETFIINLFDKKTLLNDDSLSVLLNFEQINENISYGFHALKAYDFIGHNGSLPGYSCCVMYKNNTTITIVVNKEKVSNDVFEYIVNNLFMR